MVNLKFNFASMNSAACCLPNLLCHNCSSLLLQRRNYSSARKILTQNMESSEVYPYIDSTRLQHWYKNWQHLRRHKLTASTFSSAIGFWPKRRVQLWLEKIGAIDPFSGNLSTWYSNSKEELALERYKMITGNRVCFPNFQVYEKTNHEYEWLGASPDGLVDSYVYGLPSGGVLEIKCPFFDGDETKAFPWKRIPLYYVPQAQGLMEILDRDWMDMYVWTRNGSSYFRINRNRAYWNVLKIALSDYWWNHVHPARELYTNSVVSDPLCELEQFVPAPKHDLCPELVIGSKLIGDSSKLLRREINGVIQVIHPELQQYTCA